MSDPDRDPDENATEFRVYVTTELPDVSDIPAMLGEEAEDIPYDIQELQGTAQQVCRHHKDTVRPGGAINSRLFVIFDKNPPETRGVLLVNLRPYHGWPDAVRIKPGEAGDAIESLSIENTDWYTERESVTDHKTDFVPEKWFALYNLLPDGHNEEFETALKAMNDGVGELGTEGSPKQLPIGLARQYHRGIRPDARSLPESIASHRSYAEREGLDPRMFAVIDPRYKDQGALIVRVAPTRDDFRCKGPIAGEMLGWMFIEFMTWDEAKQLASEQ